jgi:CDP-2,3-bis-(O-geranylgeranyl)-sn-glycerol synthase
MFSGPFEVIAEVVWFILPAWIANSMAINVSGLPVIKNFSTPIDFGRSWGGKRILGDGKTWRGLIGGVISAVICAMMQQQYPVPGYVEMTPFLGFLLGFGALFGDSAESLIKRRMGFDRGHPIFLLDHLDYIVGAFFFAWTAVPINMTYLLVACLITLPIHFLANIVAWLVKLKKNPW